MTCVGMIFSVVTASPTRKNPKLTRQKCEQKSGSLKPKNKYYYFLAILIMKNKLIWVLFVGAMNMTGHLTL
jgi:hypothetical protein